MKSTIHFLSRLRSLLDEYNVVIKSKSPITINTEVDHLFIEFDFAGNSINVASLTQLIEEEKEKIQ